MTNEMADDISTVVVFIVAAALYAWKIWLDHK
ncbi:hypothetical protein FAM18108_00174 [Lacticaseibacillus paracasei]|uniref:Uncharacterized protein n=1 Tax=Lacticaseibacillus paracasei N1115 TaxID=1446494 RepID=A0A806LHW1_LACPA|nr:hypothetical protein AF91_04080 [Lacticaseibacillus paracasei N1115]RND50530.1 hypothetical protein FAM18108_00174 [Lacticaseibacillus paracasei]